MTGRLVGERRIPIYFFPLSQMTPKAGKLPAI
jgi:hypothetical protein